MARTLRGRRSWVRLHERVRWSRTVRVGQRQLRAADAQLPAQRQPGDLPHTCGRMPSRNLGARCGGRVCVASVPRSRELFAQQGADSATSSDNRARWHAKEALCCASRCFSAGAHPKSPPVTNHGASRQQPRWQNCRSCGRAAGRRGLCLHSLFVHPVSGEPPRRGSKRQCRGYGPEHAPSAIGGVMVCSRLRPAGARLVRPRVRLARAHAAIAVRFVRTHCSHAQVRLTDKEGSLTGTQIQRGAFLNSGEHLLRFPAADG